jgi:hypothetical protein
MHHTCQDGKSSKTISGKLLKSNLDGLMSTPVKINAEAKCKDGPG